LPAAPIRVDLLAIDSPVGGFSGVERHPAGCQRHDAGRTASVLAAVIPPQAMTAEV
jgi:hypothetical protein